MTTAYLFDNIPTRQLDNNGNPVAFARLHTWIAGTTTAQVTYTDATATTPLPNPIVADSQGFFPQVWGLSAAYDLEARKADDVSVLWPSLSVNPGAPAALISAFATLLAASGGAALVGFLQGMTGDQYRTLQQLGRETVSTERFAGFDTTGATDSLTAAQAFITAIRSQGGDQRIGLWRKGTYKISSKLTLGTNQTIIFEPGVIINYTGDVSTPLFEASNQSGVYLRGNGCQINGNRAGVTIADAGNQTAFHMFGSDNILIEDFNIANFAMDGVILTGDNGSSGPCTNARIVGCDIYNSGRNGISVIHADGWIIDGGRCRSSNGTPSGPWAGVDVEPNANQYSKGGVIRGLRTQDNNGPGLKFVPGSQSLAAGSLYEVEVIGGRSRNDGLASSGSTGYPAVHFANGGAQANEVGGQVSIRDFVIESPNAMGVGFTNWDADNSPRVLLDFVQVVNPNGNLASTGNFNRSAFVMYCNTAQAITNLGKVVMRNCKAKDNRGSASMVWGFYLVTDTGKFLKEVTLVDCITEGQTASAKYDVNTALSATSNFIDVNVFYTKPRWLNVSGAQTDAGYGGAWMNFTATGTFALPQAAWCKGLTYKVRVSATSGGNVVINRASTDTIKSNGVAAANSLTLQPGDSVALVSDGVGSWNAAAAVV